MRRRSRGHCSGRDSILPDGFQLARVRRGLFGDAKPVGEGVFELKIDVGPGYRIYYGRDGKVVVILLHAGEKKRQAADIQRAQAFWQDYLRRTTR